MAFSEEFGGENYAKICKIQAIVVEVQKALLVQETRINGNTIDQFLLNNKKDILNFDIGKRFNTVLFPKGNQTTDLDKWDLTLFCLILGNVCKLPSTQDNDVNQVRITRNVIHHLPKPSISDSDYLKFANVFKKFIANALNYMNDQNLKAIINQKVDKAELPVCSEAVEAFQMSHALYLKDKCTVEELKEHMNGHNYNVLKEFEALKAALCTLPEKIISQIKPPQEVSFKLLLKNCNPEEEKELSEEQVRLFDTEIKDKSIELSHDDCTKAKDAVRSLVKRLKNKGVEPTNATHGCVCMFVRFKDFSSYMDFFEKILHGKTNKFSNPLQNLLRSCYKNDDLKVEMVMNAEQILFCFEHTLKCLKDARECAITNSADKHAQKPVLSKDPSDPFEITESDIIMSTFESELHKISDLYLTKSVEQKCQHALKAAIEKIVYSDLRSNKHTESELVQHYSTKDMKAEQLIPANRHVLSLLKCLRVDEIIKQTEYDCEDIFEFDKIDTDNYQYRYEPALIKNVVSHIVKLRDDALSMQQAVQKEMEERFGWYGKRASLLSFRRDLLAISWIIVWVSIWSNTPIMMEAAGRTEILIALTSFGMFMSNSVSFSILRVIRGINYLMNALGFNYRKIIGILTEKIGVDSYRRKVSIFYPNTDAHWWQVVPMVVAIVAITGIMMPIVYCLLPAEKWEMMNFSMRLFLLAVSVTLIVSTLLDVLGITRHMEYIRNRLSAEFKHRKMLGKAIAEIEQLKDPSSFYQKMNSEFSTFVGYVDILYDTFKDVEKEMRVPMPYSTWKHTEKMPKWRLGDVKDFEKEMRVLMQYSTWRHTEKMTKQQLEDVKMSWEALKELATSPRGKVKIIR
ncbi:uncharacterized protein LOC128240807 isoform X2 [Mya arenaria]|uniref:uncharacterized protein LOC128240807 isoform X2 n=1 Tax=Mya arenaria TaxID=6604 RepID=UPI0022E80AB9|nr:uncharacterized protein LOC128240807 isoform X2 [Mya arenaria]